MKAFSSRLLCQTALLGVLLGTSCTRSVNPPAPLAHDESAAVGAKEAQVPSAQTALASGPRAVPLPTTYATVPADLTGTVMQESIQDLAWRTFIALNWPADTSTCEADLTQNIIGGTGQRVWETYALDSDIFVASGKPAAWCNQSALNAARLSSLTMTTRELFRKTGVDRYITRTAKARHPEIPLLARTGVGTTQSIDQAVGGVLVDQNGRFARYEVRVNQDEYNYISTNNLYTKAGQKDVTINFPVGPDTQNLCNQQSCGKTGSIELKAAWKVLGANDDPTRFYTTRAIVFNDDQEPPTDSPGQNPVTLGLVGLHITHKTTSQRQWVWATFEHVDNTTKSFNNPKCPQTPVFTANPSSCTTACCTPNTETAAHNPGTKVFSELDAQGKPLHRPAQVVRVAQVAAGPVNMNYQNLLMGTVWANYQLVDAQWRGNLGSTIQPAFLANTTIETFNQGPSEPTDGPSPFPNPSYDPFHTQVSSSCLKCHSKGQTFARAPADFSFLLDSPKQ